MILTFFKTAVECMIWIIKKPLRRIETNDPDLNQDILQGFQGSCLSSESQQKLLGLLMALPHGPQKYSHAMPGLVETSCNVASVKYDEETSTYRIQVSGRSSIKGALVHLRDQIKTIGGLCGANATLDEVIDHFQLHFCSIGILLFVLMRAGLIKTFRFLFPSLLSTNTIYWEFRNNFSWVLYTHVEYAAQAVSHFAFRTSCFPSCWRC